MTKLTEKEAAVLKALRDESESDDGGGWRTVYLDNANVPGLSARTFSSICASLTRKHLYRKIEESNHRQAFGQVQMIDGLHEAHDLLMDQMFCLDGDEWKNCDGIERDWIAFVREGGKLARYKHTRHPADHYDGGGPESGPSCGGHPEYDEYEAPDHSIMIMDGRAEYVERDLEMEAWMDEAAQASNSGIECDNFDSREYVPTQKGLAVARQVVAEFEVCPEGKRHHETCDCILHKLAELKLL